MNNDIKIRYRSKQVFDVAMQVAFTSEYTNKNNSFLLKAVGYKIVDNKMYLFDFKSKDEDKDLIVFPYAMNLQQCIVFVWGWLENTKSTEAYPDTDGSVEQGFKITTEGCGWRGGSGFYSSFIAITPVWIVYGK